MRRGEATSRSSGSVWQHGLVALFTATAAQAKPLPQAESPMHGPGLPMPRRPQVRAQAGEQVVIPVIDHGQQRPSMSFRISASGRGRVPRPSWASRPRRARTTGRSREDARRARPRSMTSGGGSSFDVNPYVGDRVRPGCWCCWRAAWGIAIRHNRKTTLSRLKREPTEGRVAGARPFACLRRAWRNTGCVARPRCSPRLRPQSHPYRSGYGRSLRPCWERASRPGNERHSARPSYRV